MTRPFRNNSVYESPCVSCDAMVESATLPIPLRCASCQSELDRLNLRDKPNAVRSTTGAAS